MVEILELLAKAELKIREMGMEKEANKIHIVRYDLMIGLLEQQVSVEPVVKPEIASKTIDEEIALYEQYIDEFYTVDGKLKPCNPDAIFNWFKNKLWTL